MTLLFIPYLVFSQAQPLRAEAGPYQKFCPPGGFAQLGGTPTAVFGTAPYSYQWFPQAPLNNPQSANPIASVTVTTTFTVNITDANNETAKDTVTVFVYNYSIWAGVDTTIKEGQTVTLHGSANGATHVNWMPSDYHIYNQNSTSPDVYPNVTVTYTFSAVFPGGCILYDNLTVTVIPGKDLFFYNTMTPNADGANDFFYIGNIEKYPDNVLEIYNRYGQKVYTTSGYKNDWDGKYLNNELPAGTYFYILDTKSTTGGKHHGQVTIVR